MNYNEYCVYVLYSLKLSKTYVGFTRSLINRFKSHNHLASKGWTKQGKPWVVVHVEFYPNKQAAINRERLLKGGQGRSWIKSKILKQKHIVGLISASGGR